MEIRCECGRFRAEWRTFPNATPGRAVCYCDDCQSFLRHLGRADLLDPAGGTEVIPVYPADLRITAGPDLLKCTRLSPRGVFRWSTTCCNTPIGNTAPGYPWVGLIHCVFKQDDPNLLERELGPVKSRIMGRFASAPPPAGTSSKMALGDIAVVLPFMLKGFLLGKKKRSPFFRFDGTTPIVKPEVLTLEQRKAARPAPQNAT